MEEKTYTGELTHENICNIFRLISISSQNINRSFIIYHIKSGHGITTNINKDFLFFMLNQEKQQ